MVFVSENAPRLSTFQVHFDSFAVKSWFGVGLHHLFLFLGQLGDLYRTSHCVLNFLMGRAGTGPHFFPNAVTKTLFWCFRCKLLADESSHTAESQLLSPVLTGVTSQQLLFLSLENL